MWLSKETRKWHLWRVQCDQIGRTQNHYNLNELFYPLCFSLAGWLRPFQSFPEGLSAADLLWKSALRCPRDSERAALPGPRGGSTHLFSPDTQFVSLYVIKPQCIVHIEWCLIMYVDLNNAAKPIVNCCKTKTNSWEVVKCRGELVRRWFCIRSLPLATPFSLFGQFLHTYVLVYLQSTDLALHILQKNLSKWVRRNLVFSISNIRFCDAECSRN